MSKEQWVDHGYRGPFAAIAEDSSVIEISAGTERTGMSSQQTGKNFRLKISIIQFKIIVFQLANYFIYTLKKILLSKLNLFI